MRSKLDSEIRGQSLWLRIVIDIQKHLSRKIQYECQFKVNRDAELNFDVKQERASLIK